ncbi:MAG: VOC family protein [Anaerolineaceae bacterium]|nr:VOC family protein [Anaerolineaceae bacterium]
MTKPYKPQDYASVSAYIMVDGAQKLIDFLAATFDAKVTRRFDNPDGTLMHGEVQIDDTIVMLADGGEGYLAFPVWLHVYVPDVDATYQKALAAGGVSVQEPVQKEDPDRRAGVKDPTGNTWWLATQVG